MKYFLEWLEKPGNQEFVVIMTMILGIGFLIFLSSLGNC